MKRLTRSLQHAIKGIYFTFKTERNFQIESGVAMAVVFLMVWFSTSRIESIILILIMSLVLAVELTNTAVERVMDILKPRVHPYAKVVKDVMAGAVFMVSVGAAVIGTIIFLPYFIK